MTPDPSGDAWDPSNPQSWNTYAYVMGDPVNSSDPSGLVDCGDLNVTGGGTVSSYLNAGGSAGLLTQFVWAEGGTLAQSGGDQTALSTSMLLIAQAIENRLAIANGQVAVGGIDGNIYWGNGGTFNGVTTLAASILGYGGVGTSLAGELVRAAAGTGEINGLGGLTSSYESSLQSSLNQDQGDPTRNLPGRVPVTLSNGSTDYVTPECDRAILAMQATNTILGGFTTNTQGFFVTSWKANGNSNPDPTRLGNLGTVGGTTFFGVGPYVYDQYPYAPAPRRHRPIRPR
jgi:hypothetical protein